MALIQALSTPITYIRGLFGGSTSNKLGIINGVFIPCILQMIGVILFMRLGWVLGHVGLPAMLTIITISASIILITSFSMTSVVTNMKIGGGGSYFIISRSLGPEFGSAIGVLLTFSQIVSIALNVSGISYSVHYELFPQIPLVALEVFFLILLTGITYISTSFAIRFQMVVLAFIIISLISIFFGGVDTSGVIQGFDALPSMSMTLAFAMFFPAMVGIEAGMSLSGDLEKPQRDLPIGTIAAVIAGFALYSTMAYFLSKNVPLIMLRENTLVLSKVIKLGFGVILGAWGATISSGMGSLLGAPRTMQALAVDGVYPKFLSKGYGESNQPRVATVVTFVVALFMTLFTDINQLIPILTMVSLLTYTLINFVSFFESLVKNPSWRPTFRTPWYISLIGSCACLLSMLVINPLASILVLFAVGGLVTWFSKQKVQGNLEDIRYAVLTYLARIFTVSLEKIEKNAKSWRPNILAIVDKELKERNLINFAHTIDQSQGFLTYGSTIPVELDRSHSLKNTKAKFKAFFEENKIPCFTQISPFDDPFLGILAMVKNYGIGPLRPNTIILRHCMADSSPENLANFLLSAFHIGKNVIILKDQFKEELKTFSLPTEKKKIDLWWGGGYYRNFEFALVISHILQQSTLWPQAQVNVKTLVSNEVDGKEIKDLNQRYLEKTRMHNVRFSVILDDADISFYKKLPKYSEDSNFSFIGLRPPKPYEPYMEYAKYYMDVIEETKDIPNAGYVLAGEEIDFEKIFR